MSEEFFSRLRERANAKMLLLLTSPIEAGIANLARDATIEALKEIMVGEMIGGVVDLHGSNTYVLTGCTSLRWQGHHGTDGEEAWVIVVKKAD